LFFECEHVRRVQDNIESRLLMKTANTSELSCRERWSGTSLGEEPNKNIFLRIVYLTIQYLIWREKFKNRLPDGNYIAGELIYTLDPSCRHSSFFLEQKNNNDSNLSRLWGRLSGSRW